MSETRPSPVACFECRKRHLKCDAGQPKCSRCYINGTDCSYLASRRGRTRCLRRRAASPANVLPARGDASARRPSSSLLAPSPHPAPSSGSPVSPADQRFHCANGPASIPGAIPPRTSGYLKADLDCFVGLYYAMFHPNHPMLVPHAFFSREQYPAYLQQVMQYTGSHYAAVTGQETLRESIDSALSSSGEKTPHMVQALLLMSILLHARYEVRDAATYLAKAVDMAIEMGMHRPDYASAHGRGLSLVEESWRRTWWELYIVNGYFAALHQQKSFKCDMVPTHAFLPCTESAYATGACGMELRTLDEFESRMFLPETSPYSSFCFRIETIRILSRVLALTGNAAAHSAQVQVVDSAISAWRLRVKSNKIGVINGLGEPDLLLIQANVFIHCASVILHFPRSELPLSLTSLNDIECVRQARQPLSQLQPHAMKALFASEQIAALATLPISIENLSPLFICGLVFSCVVQLAACGACGYEQVSRPVQEYRDRIGLLTSALATLGSTWKGATHVMNQLNCIARGVFGLRMNISCTDTNVSPLDSGIRLDDDLIDFSWLDSFFNNIIYDPTAVNMAFPDGETTNDGRHGAE